MANKATVELRAYAGAYTAEAVDGLVKILRTSVSDQARVSAARELLDRSHGKAPQAVLVAGDPANLTPIRQIIHQYMERDAS